LVHRAVLGLMHGSLKPKTSQSIEIDTVILVYGLVNRELMLQLAKFDLDKLQDNFELVEGRHAIDHSSCDKSFSRDRLPELLIDYV
jgi:hypothetical protein